MTIAHGERSDQRQLRALALWEEGTPIRETEPDVFVVPSATRPGVTYLVDYRAETCTCGDQQNRGVVCKHLYLVGIFYAKHHRRVLGPPHACTDGLVILEHEVGGEQVISSYPCVLCAEETS